MTRTSVLWAFLFGGLVGFVAIALAYEHDPLMTVDLEVSEWVFQDEPEWLTWVARPFSWLGGWIGLTVLGCAAVVVLVRERAPRDLLFFLVAYLGAQVLVQVLKELFDRLRPEIGSSVPLPESFAFPSGHATAGVASIGALAVLASERMASRRARVWLWSVVAVGAVAIGLSRIALNVHFVTDVLAGWCLGLAWLSACLLVRDALRA